MSKSSRVAVILGSGPRVGHSVSKELVARGYQVVLVSRTARSKNTESNISNMAADFSKPDSVVAVFDKITASFGLPSIVVYNASPQADSSATDPLDVDLDEFQQKLAVNTVSVFVAAKEAVRGFQQLPDSASRTFIYTGNCLNTSGPLPRLMTGVLGKSATAHLIQSAAAAYSAQGFKFYYADERKADGSPAYGDIDGEAHGTFYASLTEHKEQGPPLQTFVKGEGYKKFPSS